MKVLLLLLTNDFYLFYFNSNLLAIDTCGEGKEYDRSALYTETF
jgi:hypothetical protein